MKRRGWPRRSRHSTTHSRIYSNYSIRRRVSQHPQRLPLEEVPQPSALRRRLGLLSGVPLADLPSANRQGSVPSQVVPLQRLAGVLPAGPRSESQALASLPLGPPAQAGQPSDSPHSQLQLSDSRHKQHRPLANLSQHSQYRPLGNQRRRRLLSANLHRRLQRLDSLSKLPPHSGSQRRRRLRLASQHQQPRPLVLLPPQPPPSAPPQRQLLRLGPLHLPRPRLDKRRNPSHHS